jgi:hypothetical protein
MTRIFGIRHHGPGSALSLRTALADYAPDCVLIEGPPEADALLPLVADSAYQPPLAILLSRSDKPSDAVFYPFAEFSPEWCAIQFALAHAVPVRFCDWPAAAALAYAAQASTEAHSESTAADAELENSECDSDELADARLDPIAQLASAAGEADPEAWWDSLIEQQPNDLAVFDAINEAMAAGRAAHPDVLFLRQTSAHKSPPRNALREACMRQAVRDEVKLGARKIAVVCGAFHAPALTDVVNAKADAPLLLAVKTLAKSIKLDVAWVPWSQSRLSLASAYGAGMPAPAWYADIFAARSRAHVRFLARAAACLRAADLDASSASVIEAVRLSETLSAMRGRRLPGLAEVREATITVLARGDELRYSLIASELEIAERFGTVSENAPSLPLRRDFEARLKSLRLKRTDESKLLDLDLREANGLARSVFFHQCQLLGLAFAKPEGDQVRSGGSFHEYWRLKFVPEDELKLIEASALGASVLDAATQTVLDALSACELADLTEKLRVATDAELAAAVPALLRAISESSAGSDAMLLLAALPPLLTLHRFGSVRGFAPERIAPIIEVMLARMSVGLTLSARGINSESSEALIKNLQRLRPMVEVSQRADWQTAFAQAVLGLQHDASRDTAGSAVHPMLRGFAARFAFEQSDGDAATFANTARLALSPVVTPAAASDWILGALNGPVVILQHGELLSVIDGWVSGLVEEDFIALLPALRRAFSEFDSNERRVIAQKVSSGQGVSAAKALSATSAFDTARVELVLPTILELIL